MQDSNKAKLIIFIDAYPYHYNNFLKDILPENFNLISLKPCFGFSINQKVLLFSGKPPDEIGYFNEWVPKKVRFGVFERLLFLVVKLIPIPKFEGLLHRIYSKIKGLDYYRIPFGIKSFWKRNPTEVYNHESKDNSLFTKYEFERILYKDYASKMRDDLVFKKTIDRINSNKTIDRLLITLADCDSSLHRTGGKNEEAIEICKKYSLKLNEVTRSFLSKYPNGKLIILSDHGMSNVTSGIKLNLRKKFGKMSQKRYLAFTDATMTRIWYYDDDLKKKIRNYLSEIESIIYLDEAKRSEYGILNQEFGDDIYTVKSDHLMFEPNYYGRKRVNGMHGYLPSFESQKGVFLGNVDLKEKKEINADEVYNFLDKFIRE